VIRWQTGRSRPYVAREIDPAATNELREDNQARATQRVIRGAGVVYLLPLPTTDIVLEAGLSKTRCPMKTSLGFVTLLIGIVLAGCASLPPARPIQDVKILAGVWEGWVKTPSGGQDLRVVVAIKEDGSYVTTSPTGTTTGTIYLSDGQPLFKTSRPSNGTVTLYEGEGKRVLRFVSTDEVSMNVTQTK
jgi:hypothetical protein